MSHRSDVKLTLCMLALWIGATPALAQVQEIAASSGTYKVEKNAFGDAVPVGSAPMIEVYSSDGQKYGFVGNDNQSLPFLMKVSGRCAARWRLYSARAWIDVEGGNGTPATIPVNSNNRTLGEQQVVVACPYVPPDIPRTPVEACNFELDKRAAQGQSRENLLMAGFVVRYDNAYTGRFRLACTEDRLIGFEDLQDRATSTQLPVYIKCMGTTQGKPAGGGKPAQPDPGDGPHRAPPEPKRVKPEPQRVPARPEVRKKLPMITSITLDAEPASYKGTCPRRFAFRGKITVDRPVKLEYRFEADDDWTSDKYTLEFAGPGTKSVFWARTMDALPTQGDLAAPGVPKKLPVRNGWMRLRVGLADEEPGRTLGTRTSDQAEFTLDCNPPDPGSVIQAAQPSTEPEGKPLPKIQQTIADGRHAGEPVPANVIQAVPALPDLRIKTATVDPSKPTEVQVEVVNIGPAASAATGVRLWVVPQGTAWYGPVPALAAGQSAWTMVQADMPVMVAQRVYARVDDPDQVEESDEGNNGHVLK